MKAMRHLMIGLTILVAGASFAATDVGPTALPGTLTTKDWEIKMRVNPVCSLTGLNNVDFGTVNDQNIGSIAPISAAWNVYCTQSAPNVNRTFGLTVACDNPSNPTAKAGFNMKFDGSAVDSEIPFNLSFTSGGSAGVSGATQLSDSTLISKQISQPYIGGLKDQQVFVVAPQTPSTSLIAGLYKTICAVTVQPD